MKPSLHLAIELAVVWTLVASLAGAQAVASGSVRLSSAKPLRNGVDAWPLIENPETPAQVKVNARLTHLNEVMLKSLANCDASYNAALRQMGSEAQGQSPASEDQTRTVAVTMRGPRYLSMTAAGFADCGGAHPSTGEEAMVFDLTTGAPVNWMALVARSAGASAYTDTGLDGTTVGALMVPALRKLYLAGVTDPDCKGAFGDPQPFLVWPDAKNGTLDVEPFDLPQVTSACSNEMNLNAGTGENAGVQREDAGRDRGGARRSGRVEALNDRGLRL